jgi:hypothetical protein
MHIKSLGFLEWYVRRAEYRASTKMRGENKSTHADEDDCVLLVLNLVDEEMLSVKQVQLKVR